MSHSLWLDSSQRFLKDSNIIRKIIEMANIHRDDVILEIGPGTGALTRALIVQAKEVIAIERDSRFIPTLRQEFPTLYLLEGDALKIDFASLMPRRGKCVANLPYHITSPLLDKILPRSDLFETATLMVQKEVALRLVAEAGHSDYSALSLFAHAYSTPTLAFIVSRNCFHPRPKVDSAVVHFHLRPSMDATLLPTFFLLVKTAFKGRRKMLKKTLAPLLSVPAIAEVLAFHALPLDVRPDRVPLACFQALAQYYVSQKTTP